MRDVACKLALYMPLCTLTDIDYEFNDVIQEFCEGFENPRIRTSGDIIEYNKQHADRAMPPRQDSQNQNIIEFDH
jgi:amidase